MSFFIYKSYIRKSIFLIFFFFTFIAGCSRNKKTVEVERRVLYDFYLDSLKRNYSYTLTVVHKDSIINYEYINMDDSEKNISIEYNLHKGIISFYDVEFEIYEKNQYFDSEVSSKRFDLYRLKRFVDDGNGPMLFNRDYGLLNIDNGWGTILLFFQDTSKASKANKILQILKK